MGIMGIMGIMGMAMGMATSINILSLAPLALKGAICRAGWVGWFGAGDDGGARHVKFRTEVFVRLCVWIGPWARVCLGLELGLEPELGLGLGRGREAWVYGCSIVRRSLRGGDQSRIETRICSKSIRLCPFCINGTSSVKQQQQQQQK